MGKKATEFRRQAERSGPKKAKRPAKPRRDVEVDTSLPGVSATDRKVGKGDTAKRNASKRAAKKGGAKLETSEQARPSRRSTRKSEGRSKTTSQLERRATRATTSPKARASRAKARKK